MQGFPPRGVPLLHHPEIRRIRRRKRIHGRAHVFRHGLEHGFEKVEDAAGGGFREACVCEPSPEASLAAGDHCHGERISRLFGSAQVADLQAGEIRLRRSIRRIILKHQNTVEQRSPPGDLRPCLNIDQRNVAVFDPLNALRLNQGSPFGNGHVAAHLDACRDRVDKQPHHRFSVLEHRRPAGNGQPEQDIRGSAIPAQQPGPRTHEQAVWRYVMLLGPLLYLRGEAPA